MLCFVTMLYSTLCFQYLTNIFEKSFIGLSHSKPYFSYGVVNYHIIMILIVMQCCQTTNSVMTFFSTVNADEAFDPPVANRVK